MVVCRWMEWDEPLTALAQGSYHAYRAHGLIQVFCPIEPRLDVAAAQQIAALLDDVAHHIFADPLVAGQTIGFLSRMQVVVSMRLHGLIFAAGQGVPLVGVVYDPKVSAFLSYIGQDFFLDLSALTGADLMAQIDAAVLRGQDRAFLLKGVERLREIESQNSRTAARLLDRPVPEALDQD